MIFTAWQRAEIDRDSLIFDFVLVMTIVLAAVCPALVANRVSSAESLHYE